jgi:hypothetical protein
VTVKQLRSALGKADGDDEVMLVTDGDSKCYIGSGVGSIIRFSDTGSVALIPTAFEQPTEEVLQQCGLLP